MTALAFLLALLAFALFGLSTDEHHRKRLGARPDAVTVLRLRGAAWAAVAAAFPFAIAAPLAPRSIHTSCACATVAVPSASAAISSFFIVSPPEFICAPRARDSG